MLASETRGETGMTHESEWIPLGADRPGTQRSLLVHRYGDPVAGP